MPEKRPEATNTGGWVDAEDPIADTVSTCATLLDFALSLHRGQLDDGQTVMLETAVHNLETLRLELELPDGFDDDMVD
jgi:hypothetical protein